MLALVGFGSYNAASAAPPADKPNIIFVISDDQRWDDLGIAGNTNLKTPNLDRMAREGQWYREAVIQIPTCSASRAAILTGLPPAINGWYSNQQQRRDLIEPDGFVQYKLLPKELSKAGYHTAFVGKWHISPDPWLCGFQTIKRWMEEGSGAYKDPVLSNGPERASKMVSGFTQTLFADDAIEIIKETARPETTQPLFLWLAFTAPHAPFGPNPSSADGSYTGQSEADLAPETFYDDTAKTRQGKQTWQSYSEATTALDVEMGRVLDTVRNSSISSNTLVVFIGDNGFMMGRRGLHGKYLPYDDSLRVPLIVWGPDSIVGARGTTVTASVNSLDLPPTFLKLAGAALPVEWVGRDISAVMKDGKPHDITWSVSSYPDHSKKLGHVDAYRTIRTESYKLITWHPEAKLGPELYDLKADPAENVNLYGKPELAEKQARLEKLLAEYRKDAGDNEWNMKGPVVDFQTQRPDGTFAKSRKEYQKKKHTGKPGKTQEQ